MTANKEFNRLVWRTALLTVGLLVFIFGSSIVNRLGGGRCYRGGGGPIVLWGPGWGGGGWGGGSGGGWGGGGGFSGGGGSFGGGGSSGSW